MSKVIIMSTSRINAAGVQYVRDQLAHVPRPDREASRAIGQWLKQQGHEADPDQIDVVTLHYHAESPGNYLAAVSQCMSLTQAVLGNWQGESDNDLFGALFRAPWAGTLPDGNIRLVESLPAPPFNHYGEAFAVFNGVFRRTEPQRYDATTHLPIAAEAFQAFIEALDFHTPFKQQLDDYWREHLQDHRLACKLNFIAACNQQVSEGSLSEAAQKLIWQAAGLQPRSGALRMSTLSIYGYAATDLLYLNAPASDLTVLYLPGNRSPLLEFASEGRMKDWIGEQCKDPTKRQALKQHFRLADRPQGIDFSGLDTAMEGLGDFPNTHRLPPEHGFFNDDGVWAPRLYVNYRPGKYNPRITGDLFQALAERQRQRSYDDADYLITRDSDVTKAKWRGYLVTTLNLLAPLCLVVPGLAPLLAAGGIAQLGFGLDQAINGKTLQEKQEGVGNTTWGVLNALPLALGAANKAKALFEFKGDGFVPPSRLGERVGYPLSPVSPPHWPEPEGAAYFRVREPIAPLPDADPAIADSVIRVPLYDGGVDNLDARIGGYNDRVVYDMERDVFIREQDLNEVDPAGYIAQDGNLDLQPAPAGRTVTDAMRIRSLRALGVDLPLPVEIPSLPAASLPIPRRISCLWVGDKVIEPHLVTNLARNATRLQGSEYNLRLFLSSAAPDAYAENLRLLEAQAPGVQVLPLEEQAFFRAFRQSKYYAQYHAALDGNGGIASNYASASDVLRYPMLHHEGGLYMDVDDALLAPAESAQAINQVDLLAASDGLLLAPPMSNEKLGMNCLYNSSLIGSQPGNPLLEAIAEEMHARYQNNLDFYDSKPSLSQDPANFYRYANRLSRLTGPALLTDVVDRHLPALRTLRQITNLCIMPRINAYQFVDLPGAQQAMDSLLPLNRFAKVGANHSWSRT